MYNAGVGNFHLGNCFESEEKNKVEKIYFNFQDNANRTHTSLLRWPFAATLHAKWQSLDWYTHMRNIFIGQMTKVLVGTLDLRTGTGHLQVMQMQCDERWMYNLCGFMLYISCGSEWISLQHHKWPDTCRSQG